ncbi:hypothetical protein EL22_07770 [Halostagnicola sp. A56]|uniref:polysaccharide deacetylase family protein n=1 Tax=Halostagnicola sp. A56 TaxID=1495067 RepID=UPI0004A01E9A|nr:hypothetical protein [Halostagnicola sp. A56]KDE58018.1 hypothetical protein EL22_07770 [Halostagnicola sp. A56]
MTKRNRRSFIAAAAVGATAGLAGCASEVRESLPFQTDDSETDGNGDEDDGGNGDDDEQLPGESIADFEDIEQWEPMLENNELEAASDDSYAGSQSAKLTADESTEYAGIERTITGGLDLSGRNLSLAVKFTGREQLHLTVDLLAPGSNSVHSLTRSLIGPRDRWVRVDLGTTGVDSHTDLSSVHEIRIAARRRGGEDGAIECQVDDLRSVSRPEKGKVMLLFDGTLESHRSEAFEPMQEHDFVGVESVIPNTVNSSGRLSYSSLQELSEGGWEMLARPGTGSSRLPDYSAEEQRQMIGETQSYLESRGFEDGARHFVTPGNVLGPNTMDILREQHEQAFRYGGSPNALPLTDPHNVGVFPGTEGDVTREYVGYAAEYGQLAVLRFEQIGDGGMAVDEFEDLLAYIDEQNVEVVTASDLLET